MKLFVNVTAYVAVFILAFLTSCSSDSKTKEDEIRRFSEDVNEALSSGNIDEAYAIIDTYIDYSVPVETEPIFGNIKNSDELQHARNLRDKARSLNDKVLKNEIAELVANDNGGDNAPNISFAIYERAKYNVDFDLHIETEQKKLFDYAIQLAKSMDNDKLVNKLKKAQVSDKK